LRVNRIINNLQVKVTLLFLLVSLVPLGIVGAFSISTAEELIFKMVSNQLESVADDKVNLLERWLSERRADLKVVSDSSIVRSMDPDKIASYLELVRLNYEVYRDFKVVSKEGIDILKGPGGDRDHRGEEWFEEAMAGRTYLSGITLEPGKSESVFWISSPIFDGSGGVKGAVRATVGTHTILSIILRVSLGETGESYLVDSNGAFLAHQDPRRILSENISQSGSFGKIFGGSQYQVIYTDYRGIEVLGASRHVAGTPWHLVVEQDRAEAFASVLRLKRYIYLAIFLCICITLVLSWLLAYYIVKPIQELGAAAHALERGEFDGGRVMTRRTDEIGALFTAFGDMARQLQARHHSLEEKVDLTEAELKEREVRLRETEEAAARSERLAALGRLAAGVTHEIRTPLTSLKLFLQSVRDEVEFSPESKEDHRVAMKQISRIEATINRFLDFAKPQEPVFSDIYVERLIDDALMVAQPRAIQQETLVNKEIAHDLPVISGDRKQLGEALLNLMVNALEAMSKGDVLTVSADACPRRLDGRVIECVRIEVGDTGEGVEPGKLERLFDPFFTTKASGTGLGLSIVHSTVVRHGGEVTVESEPGRGTRFTVFLPVTGDGRREADEQDLHS
jgi:signal transduction histidine kinase